MNWPGFGNFLLPFRSSSNVPSNLPQPPSGILNAKPVTLNPPILSASPTGSFGYGGGVASPGYGSVSGAPTLSSGTDVPEPQPYSVPVQMYQTQAPTVNYRPATNQNTTVFQHLFQGLFGSRFS